jgi:hypothetical protein
MPEDRNPFEPDVTQTSEVVSLIRRAVDGFSSAELEYLERVSIHPAFEEYRTVLRAPAIDWLGATYGTSLPDTLSWLDIRRPRYRPVRDATHALIANAALELSRGRESEAEQALLEVITLGLTLTEQDLTLLGSFVGSIIVGNGLDALEELYTVTGRGQEALRLRTVRDSVDGAATTLDETEEQLRTSQATQFAFEVRVGLIRDIQDTTSVRGRRWEMLALLARAPCTNMRELIFGPDPTLTALFDHVRQDLVRFPSEEELLRLLEEAPQRMVHASRLIRGDFASRAIYTMGRVTGAILGNDRIAGCTMLLPSVGEFF